MKVTADIKKPKASLHDFPCDTQQFKPPLGAQIHNDLWKERWVTLFEVLRTNWYCVHLKVPYLPIMQLDLLQSVYDINLICLTL
jgi:hypothetical protein